MAVGIAVLVSMLFAPHEEEWQWLGKYCYVFAGYVPYVCRTSWFPIFWRDKIEMHSSKDNPTRVNLVLWPNFIGQTAFLAVLAAVLVNLGRRKTK